MRRPNPIDSKSIEQFAKEITQLKEPYARLNYNADRHVVGIGLSMDLDQLTSTDITKLKEEIQAAWVRIKKKYIRRRRDKISRRLQAPLV